MTTTTYASLSQRTTAYAESNMLAHAEPILVLSKLGKTLPFPKNTADTVKFRRPIPFPPATTPLTEGVSPSPRAMQYEDVTVQMSQYGDVVQITDRVQDMAEDPVLKDATALCGEQAAETLETLIWGVLKGGTTVVYNNGAARSAVNTAITLAKIRSVVRTLKAQRAKAVTKMVSSSVNYNTSPVQPAYVAVGHTDVEADLRALGADFVPTEKYGSQVGILPFEVGKVEGVRFCLSPMFTSFPDAGGAAGSMKSTTGTSADVYPVVYFGQEAFGSVVLKGAGSMTPMVLQPGVARGGDPLGMSGTVGWKTYFKAVRLNETWLVRHEVAVTA